ncbi:hypothetical protein [Simiduia aestuariiviva]|uniref:SIR2-like domain-containing protein n=1 Tax=Simiduia aestuariiviva TaxID=1510459 RepID=A0A839UTB1_9GAMM|nr:hypothetical protein [Simiduia aestuariiviva]MBB3169961.1 hypothetical protein [Simiduia aestuariiviva]
MTNHNESRTDFNRYVRKNRVFILGAGFSADAGIPLTAPLLKHAMHKFSEECNGIFQRVDAYAHVCVEEYGGEDLDYLSVDFSDLCTFLEYIELREYGGGERWRDEGSREKLALRYYLAKSIVEHTPSAKNIPELYLKFASQLHEQDVVITFNWDGLLEAALNKVGKTFTYNWEDDKAIKLCKLHGSINWRLNEPNDLGRPVNTLDWKSLKFTEGIMENEIYFSNALLRYETWQHYEPLGEVEPFLVLPGYGKAFDVRSNAVLWYKPESAFCMTHDVYIIGLSLAPDDFFIRSLFLSNFPFVDSSCGVEGRKIFIINPDRNAGKNYEFLLAKGQAELINKKFSLEHIELMQDRLRDA